jgi:tetrahydromethanopterin:alpha-L-glutamate ligase
MRIALFAEDPDWHCRRLVAAFRRHGAEAVVGSLRICRFHIADGAATVEIPGFDGDLPDIVFVRSIPNGSFEQVTFRLSLLHALGELGVRVVNTARAIERCVDKSMTSFLLARAGIPTPETFVTEMTDAAEAWRGAQPADIVAKPLFGAQGRGLVRLDREAALPDPATNLNGVLYLQNYVGRDSEWRDYRVFVVGDAAVAAMARRGASWITNVARGGSCEPAAVAGRLGALAVAASRAVGADYCGVDLIETAAGELVVLEVNSMPAWKGLQGVAEGDIADRIASHVVAI